MFKDLSENDIIQSITALLREGNLNSSDYAVWWKGNLLSPGQVISIAYQLKGNPLDRRSFTTDSAQKRLLELGFPIVEKITVNDFFSEKELNSFSVLVNTRFYDKNNPVDKNIGEFIAQVIWKKTKVWRNKLVEKGWFKDHDKFSWQTQSSSKKGNNYKKYTWYRLYPNIETKKLVFFTVGVGRNGDLEYKLDIQESDDFFSSTDKEWFYSSLGEQGAIAMTISKENVHLESWGTLAAKSDYFFEQQLDLLNKVSSHFWPEKRLMRMVYNVNNWHVPMERYWNKKYQGKKNKAHHEQYGFGFEEWLFNPRYTLEGYQYGYIRGVDTMPGSKNFIDELYLYTIEPKSKIKQLIARINDVVLLKDDDTPEDVIELFEGHRADMLSELDKVNADVKLLRQIDLKPNVEFKLENLFFYQEPIPLPEDLVKIPRFIPLKVHNNLLETISQVNESNELPRLNFNEGNGTGVNKYQQNSTGGERTVNRTHADITNQLHDYLLNSKDYDGYKISTEKTKVGNNLVDCAAKKDGTFDFFEVKTSKSFLLNIRLALGQILEYALLDSEINIEKLIIVGPATPSNKELEYFNSLKNHLKIPLFYWSYSIKSKEFSDKF